MRPALGSIPSRPLWPASLLRTSRIERAVLVRPPFGFLLFTRLPHRHASCASPAIGVRESALFLARLPLPRSDNHWQSFPDTLESP